MIARLRDKLQNLSWGVGLKLGLVITGLLLPAVGSVVYLANRLFIADATSTLYQINSDAAQGISLRTREILGRMLDRASLVGSILVKNPLHGSRPSVTVQDLTSPLVKALVAEQFKSDAGLQAVLVSQMNSGVAGGPVLADWYSATLEGTPDRGKGQAASWMEELRPSLANAAAGEWVVTTLSSSEVAIVSPLVVEKGVTTYGVIGLYSFKKLAAALEGVEQVSAYIVDREGRLLIHSDPARARLRESLVHLPVVKDLLNAKVDNGQTRYLRKEDSVALLAAYRSSGVAGLGVISEIPEEKAFELAGAVVRRSLILALIVLGVAIMVGSYFARTLTRPVDELALAAQAVAKGDFGVQLIPRSRDELGHLAEVFNVMTAGLIERDKVKDVFKKFHNEEIAAKILSGEVKLGGEKYEAVVFFSDIRGFTALSETMSPHDLVEMLNEYMSCMVRVIREHQGVVDKFVGDAIMAIWGVPFSTEWDSMLAVRACLSMREELVRLNEKRIARGQVPLKIGMGLNMGPLIAGNIGSEEKMEFTVIGDTVNTASRLESMTKAYGTDLLISESVFKQTQGEFIVETCAAGKVKGKSEALQVYKVKGYYEAKTKNPVLIETPYSSYAAEKSDKVESSHEDKAA